MEKMSLSKRLYPFRDGATLNPKTLQPVDFSKGYAVSLTDNETQRPGLTLRKVLRQAAALVQGDWYIGYWRDERTGRHYLDVSIVVEDKAEAVRIGRQYNQKAIFDFSNMEVVYI